MIRAIESARDALRAASERTVWSVACPTCGARAEVSLQDGASHPEQVVCASTPPRAGVAHEERWERYRGELAATATRVGHELLAAVSKERL